MRVTFFARWTFDSIGIYIHTIHAIVRNNNNKRNVKYNIVQCCTTVHILWVTWIGSQAAVALIRFTLPLITSKTTIKCARCAHPSQLWLCEYVLLRVMCISLQSINSNGKLFYGTTREFISISTCFFFLRSMGNWRFVKQIFAQF